MASPVTTCSRSCTSNSSPVARYADIVLPATTQIEQSDVVQAWGHLWLGWNEAAIEPIGESCRNTELMRRHAGAMGYTEPALFEDDDTILVQALGSKEALGDLKASGWAKVPYPDDGRPFGDGVFPTKTGRVQDSSTTAWRRSGSRCCRRSSRRPRVPTATRHCSGATRSS